MTGCQHSTDDRACPFCEEIRFSPIDLAIGIGAAFGLWVMILAAIMAVVS